MQRAVLVGGLLCALFFAGAASATGYNGYPVIKLPGPGPIIVSMCKAPSFKLRPGGGLAIHCKLDDPTWTGTSKRASTDWFNLPECAAPKVKLTAVDEYTVAC